VVLMKQSTAILSAKEQGVAIRLENPPPPR